MHVFTEKQVESVMGLVRKTWKDLGTKEILDAPEVGVEKPVAEALGSEIKRIICSPVPRS